MKQFNGNMSIQATVKIANRGGELMKTGRIISIAVLCIVAMAVVPFTVYGADKLLVKDGSSVTQFVVTDAGKIGLGTGTPNQAITISKTGVVADLAVIRTDGAGNIFNAGGSYANFGSIGTHPMRLLVNSTWKMQLNNDNSVAFVNGASISAGGVWANGSSRTYKENISELNSKDANAALDGLNPVLYSYKAEKGKQYVGFIAEDVPDLVAMTDRKSVSPMDIVAVLTRVVKEQKQTVESLAATVAKLEGEINRLKSKDYSAQK
jgi:hypothetical protein